MSQRASGDSTPLPQSKAAGQPVFRRAEITLRVICPSCRTSPPDLEENFAAGDLVCRSCGTIVGDRIIDTRSEWRTFTNESGGAGDDPSRVGGPTNPLLDTDPLETMISIRDGNTGASKDLSRLQNRANFRPAEKNLLGNFRAISTFCERIGLTRVIADRAKQIFKKADEQKLTKGGRYNDAVVSACIYIACRQEQVPRTFKEISSLTKIPRKDIGRCFKELQPLLEDHVGVVETDSLIARYCSLLHLGMEAQRLAMGIVQRAVAKGLATGKSPISVAAASIFMANRLSTPSVAAPLKSFKEIGQVAGISENTVKGNYRDLYVHRADLVPETFPKDVLDRLPAEFTL